VSKMSSYPLLSAKISVYVGNISYCKNANKYLIDGQNTKSTFVCSIYVVVLCWMLLGRSSKTITNK